MIIYERENDRFTISIVVNNLLHTTGQIMHIVYITFAMFFKHYLVMM